MSSRFELVEFTTTPHAEIEWTNVVLTCAIDEAFGRSTAEGLKAGRPVIGARSGGTREIVTDGLDGILFEPGDVEGVARAMQQLALDPQQLHEMASAAQARNRARFEIDGEVAGVADVLAQAAPRERR